MTEVIHWAPAIFSAFFGGMATIAGYFSWYCLRMTRQAIADMYKGK